MTVNSWQLAVFSWPLAVGGIMPFVVPTPKVLPPFGKVSGGQLSTEAQTDYRTGRTDNGWQADKRIGDARNRCTDRNGLVRRVK